MKLRLKLADIRKDTQENSCPFGLPIPFGCQYASKHVDRMAPLDIMDKISEEEKQMISNANTKLLAWDLLRSSEKPAVCKYAGHIFEDKDAVECNYNDSAPGEGPGQALVAAPFYSKIFNTAVNGLYTYPLGYYSDYNISRNLFFGTYSLSGSWCFEMINKVAK